MKYLWFSTCLFLSLFNIGDLSAQSLNGRVLDKSSGKPIADIPVKIDGEVVYTNSSGKFFKEELVGDTVTLIIRSDNYEDFDLLIPNPERKNLFLGIIFLGSANETQGRQLNDNYVLEQRELDQLEIEEQNISGLLSAAWDPFGSQADYNFSVTRFNPRGLHQNYSMIYLNALPFNNLNDGRYFWSLWGGLNDVFRSRYSQHGMNTTDYSLGGMSGVLDIDLRASSQWKQTRLSLSTSNRSYEHRAMLTHSSGLSESGWSYSLSFSRRWGNSGFIEGTYYDAYAYFASIEKEFNNGHALNLVAFAAPTIRGRGSASTQEMYDIAGNNYYNPNWGFQNGKVRNSREYRSHQPVFMLRHDWKLADNTIITSSAAYQTGYFGSTRLDWLEAADPRPDYYRNLPYAYRDNPAAAAAVRERLAADETARQIDFDELININRQRLYLVKDPEGNPEGDFYENISAYIIEEQRFDNDKMAIQSHINHRFSDISGLNAGIQLQYDKNHNYKLVDDLLGGSYFLDIDDFALRDFPDDYNIIQNDLSQPNRLLTEGDVFGYNYFIHNQNANIWGNYNLSLSKLDIFLAASLQQTRFWRDGLVRNGKFPESSLGDSEVQSYTHGMAKAGVTYKIDGRNYMYSNLAFMSRAPFSRYAFLSPQTRNELASGLEKENTMGFEAGYVLRHPTVNARLTGFYYRSEGGLNSVSFYQDEIRSFVNYSITGIDKVSYGLEFGAEIALSQVLNLGVASALGEYYYDSRPGVTITQDNNAETLVEDRTVYFKGFNIAGIPQIAHTMELEYRSPDFWSINLSANYFDDIYIDPNPDRRTASAIDGVSPDEDPVLYNEILGQEKFDPGFTLDLFARKSFKFNNHYLYLSIGLNNLLDNRDFRIGGYEQLRFDFEGKDPERFAPRYYYAYGRTYFLSISYRI